MTKTTVGICSAPTLLDHAEAVARRHLHVEEHEVGMLLLDRRHRLRAVAALADHLDVFFLLQQPDDALARHRLVVDDQRSDLGHATLSMSDSLGLERHRLRQAPPIGMTMHTSSPPPGGLPELEPVQRPVEMLEPRPGVRQPDAAIEVSQSRRRQPDAVVLDVELEHGAVTARLGRRSGPASACGPMPCLMAFSTSGCSKRFGTSASSVSGSTSNATCQTVAEARLFDLQVLAEEVELLLQRHFLHADASAATGAADR